MTVYCLCAFVFAVNWVYAESQKRDGGRKGERGKGRRKERVSN